MTNIAIVLSANNYSGELNKLQACGRDSEAIIEMLRSGDRFADILISHDEHTNIAKERIFKFLKDKEGQDIDEVFFYFSGHGEFHEEEFYFLLKDYKTSKRRQTSIINSELDDAVRVIKPRLYAKIIDACHSGISYVKNTENIKGFLERTKPPLKDIYFLFSSQHDQSSWQSENLSDFTASIINAACDHSGDTLKYKDVINFVVDDFEVRGGQTPFFVNQGSFTDVFCEITPELKAKLMGLMSSSAHNENMLVDTKKSNSIADLVRAEASFYCTKEEALTLIGRFPDLFKVFELDPEFADLYDILIIEAELSKLPSPDAIGSWLSVKREGDKYFAEPVSVSRPYKKRVRKPMANLGIVAGLVSSLSDDENYIEVTDYKPVIEGYKNTFEMPFDVMFLGAKSKYPNLPEACCFIAPILSRTTVRVFYAFGNYDWVDWENKRLVGKVDWQSVEAAMKDEASLDALVSQIFSGFKAFIQDPIAAKYRTNMTNDIETQQ